MYENEFKSFLGKENENVNGTYLKQTAKCENWKGFFLLEGWTTAHHLI